MVFIDSPRGYRSSQAWDGLGRVVHSTDPLGNEVRREYVAAERRVRTIGVEIGGSGPVTRWQDVWMDERGRARRAQNQSGQVVLTDFDDRDLAVQTTLPDETLDTAEFGLLGEVVARTQDGDQAGRGEPPARSLDTCRGCIDVESWRSDSTARRAVDRVGAPSSKPEPATREVMNNGDEA